MNAVMSYNNSKKREREEISGNGERTIRIHCSPVESVEQVYKARPGDSPIKAKKGELVTQWEQRKNQQGSTLETADDESILEVVALDEQGSQLLHRNQSAFIDHIHPILKDVHDKIQCPFAVIGSWLAQQFAHTCRESEESVSPDLECMVKIDIDCFFGEPGNGPFAMEGMPRKELINGNEVNWVKVRHFNLAGLLSNNDINATAFAIGVSEVNGMLSFEFEVSPYFWRFFLSKEHILSAVQPRHAKTRTLVQLALKSLEMHLPFND